MVWDKIIELFRIEKKTDDFKNITILWRLDDFTFEALNGEHQDKIFTYADLRFIKEPFIIYCPPKGNDKS